MSSKNITFLPVISSFISILSFTRSILSSSESSAYGFKINFSFLFNTTNLTPKFSAILLATVQIALLTSLN